MKVSRPRVHGIAKEFGLNSKDVMAKFESCGITLKNHMATLEDDELNLIFDIYTSENSKTMDDINAYLKEKKEQETPVKETAKKEKEQETAKTETVPDEEFVVENTAIEKKVRYVDTRQTVSYVDEFEAERIEELVPDNIKVGSGKQKIKKGNNKKESSDDNQLKQRKQTKVSQKKLEIKIPDSITVGELAKMLEKPATEIIKRLMMLGVMATITESIDYDTAALVAEDLGAKVEKLIVLTDEDILFNDTEDAEEDLVERAPVVVVMGHVDHGKTSLLDAIRQTNVIDTEAGGITQHIGAYSVDIKGRKITFLDTPGHEAFTTMRARGAQATDVAILVVAADDGIMPQTIEAINHARAANLNPIVAINKIDKEGANVERVKQMLTEQGLVPEEWGGDTVCVEVSAKQHTNIDELLEMVLLVADMKGLKANPNRLAKGIVIEAKLDKGRGPVATMLVQNGTLKVGDTVIAGTAVGKVRAMMDHNGKRIKEAGPSMPAEVVGLSEVPEGGDIFHVVTDERMAKEVAQKRKDKNKEEQFNMTTRVTLDNLFSQINEGQMKELNIVIKGDVQGSVEAVRQSLEKLSNDEVRLKVIHGGVGAVNESDVMLAYASNAIIVGFNVRPDPGAKISAEQQNVDIRLYRVIYEAIEEIEAAMKGMLDPEYKEVVIGHAEVRQTYKVSSVGTIAGCHVTDGKIQRNAQVRVVRDGIVIHEGELASLKRFKDDAKEVTEGYDCGMSIDKFNDIKEGDVIEGFVMEEIARD